MSKNQNEKAKSLPRPQTAKNPSKINNIEMNSHLGLENENSNLDPTSFTKTYYSKNQK